MRDADGGLLLRPIVLFVAVCTVILAHADAMTTPPPSSIPTRATNAQLRRAAGSQSLAALKAALSGWTADEINNMEDGKNAVHMAAWQGCLENLIYLSEEMGCALDTIATGEFSYGKTPIFFAATRSRAVVVEYLVDANASVRIVNNKGQSVLSIASSHLPPQLVAKILKAETEQTDEWKNYRVTHSDGLTYGDLDPRFLERSLQTQDVVTPWAVNPTTKQSRRGSFLKRNPHLPPRRNNNNNKSTTKPKNAPRPCLSHEEELSLEQAWTRVLDGIPSQTNGCQDLVTIVQLSDKRRQAWIPDAAQRLKGT
jgi:hypothetical protein